ncbi:MAG: ATP synthase F1 subunit gamma [Bacteroidales bacterium]|nr:ATP synthase F1 subunit gamma [Candidatus Equibacterium intestinale]
MSSLKEIKARIASVGSTLKITSAMKMVSSAKLRKVQNVIAGHEAYKSALLDILSELAGYLPESEFAAGGGAGSVAVVAFSSNTSLCGAFNSNVARALDKEVAALVAEGRAVTVFPVGEKVAKAAHRAGYSVDDTYTAVADKGTFSDASGLAERLMKGYLEGEFCRVVLLYTRYISAARQQITVEEFLPVADSSRFAADAACGSLHAEDSDAGPGFADDFEEFIVEPSKKELLAKLLPLALHTQVYATLLSSSASEHAARMIAMQTATDNATDLLAELQLTYNKQRQQAITEELTDISNGKLV